MTIGFIEARTAGWSRRRRGTPRRWLGDLLRNLGHMREIVEKRKGSNSGVLLHYGKSANGSRVGSRRGPGFE